MSLMSLTIGLFLGVLGSLIVAMFVEWMRKPRLNISVLPPGEVWYGNKTFVSIKARVSNDSLPPQCRPIQPDPPPAAQAEEWTAAAVHLCGGILAIAVNTPLRELGPLYTAYQPPVMNARQTAAFNFSERVLRA